MGARSVRHLRWLVASLVVSLLVLGTAHGQEDEQKEPVLLTADELDFNDELGIATAKGNVEISQGDRVLLADTVTYNQRDDVVTASGNVILLEPTGEVLFAEFAELTDDMREGFLRGFRMLLQDNSRLAAVAAQRRGGIETQLDRAAYSPCRNCLGFDDEPLWRVKARKVVHNRERQEVVYNDATLELLGVPVAYTPYLSHPDPTVKRKSGVLSPTFGSTSSLGQFVQLPYFWAISRDKDLTLDPIIFISEHPVINGEYRQAFGDGELRTRVSGTYDTTNENNERARGHIDSDAQFAIDEYWRWGANVKLASDDTYLARFGFPDNDTLTNRLYLERFGSRSYGVAEGYYFQGLRDEDIQERIPVVLPRFNYNVVSEPGEYGSYTTIDANFQALTRDEGTSSQRLSLSAGWHLPHIDSIGSITTLSARVQADVYNVADVTVPSGQVKDGVTGRVFPQLMAEWRYPWVRRDAASGVVVEPIAALVVAPNGGNPELIPNEDSQAVELDETNLFNANRFPGKDRVEGGTRVVYGLRAGFYGEQGGSSTIFVGQSYKFGKDRSFSSGSGLNDQLSDVVARITVSPNRFLSLNYRTRLEAETLRAERTEVTTVVGPRALRADITYVFFDKTEEFADREQVVGGLTSALTDRWTARVFTQRDLTQGGGTLSWGASLQYSCDCLDFSLDYRRTFTRDRDVPPEQRLLFRIIFKSLGEIGTALL